MKKFYEEFRDLSNLPWTYNYILIEKVKDRDRRIWYAQKAIENSRNKVVLYHQIDLQLFERQADNTKKLNSICRLMKN